MRIVDVIACPSIHLQVARLPQIRRLSRELLLDIIDALADDMSESKLRPDVSSLSLDESRMIQM